MDVYLDCLPCMLRQVLEASRMATDKEEHHKDIIEDAVRILYNYKKYENSPTIARDLQRIVKVHTGDADPYRKIKQNDIKRALAVYPLLAQIVNSKGNRLFWALKAAALGNVLDSAAGTGTDFEQNFETELNRDFAICDLDALSEQLMRARRVLIVGDNAGESVIDRILIEALDGAEVIYAVRSAPVLNDATMEDAMASGLGGCCTVMSSGCDVPGVVLKECSPEFRDVFDSADIVISKGQGNYETLSGCGRDIFFLLKAKCPVVARLLGVSVGDLAFVKQDEAEYASIKTMK